jgi:transcriptional regulator with XRE-family HTH domain
MISREQIKAGRAMLDWSQKALAEHCDTVSEPTIKLIETGKINSTPETLGALQKTLEDHGLEFMPQKGVRFRNDLLTIIDGRKDENVFLRLLDDIYYDAKAGLQEVLWSFVDEALSPPDVIERENMIRNAGVRYRSLIRHSTTTTLHDASEYRKLPEGLFLNNLTAVYGHKFATVVNKPGTSDVDKIIIIKNHSIAEMKRTEFDIIWHYGAVVS